MRRARAIAAVWTALIVIGATVALWGIVVFMARMHEGWNGATSDMPEAGPTVGATPPTTGRPPASVIGPALPSPVDDDGVSVPRGASSADDVGTVPAAVVDALRQRRLTVPVAGVRADALVPSFRQARGDRTHEALDIMAPAGTAVVAVEDGTVAKLFNSKAGGLTVYQFDPSRSVAYYYAHLEGYASGLDEGDTLRRGQVIGYVGSTGNANPDAPHLHFAIFRLGPERRWWEGTAIDPYLVLR